MLENKLINSRTGKLAATDGGVNWLIVRAGVGQRDAGAAVSEVNKDHDAVRREPRIAGQGRDRGCCVGDQSWRGAVGCHMRMAG